MRPADQTALPARPRRGRWFRRGLAGCGLVAAAFGVGTVAGWPVSWPFDVAANVGGAVEAPEWRVPAAGGVRVVVLQHGLFRTGAALARLARVLAAHGYEVLNPSYPSTREPLAAHAARLQAVVGERAAAGPVAAWYFVGHSMGGLVIQEYLRRADAVTPAGCVYLGTPHRGAVLADLRKHWFLFRWAMGPHAAAVLSPGAPLHAQPIPHLAASAAIAGDIGSGNAAIPGADDGTVAVAEATLVGARANGRVPYGHTRLALAGAVHRAVLQFLAVGTLPAAIETR